MIPQARIHQLCCYEECRQHYSGDHKKSTIYSRTGDTGTSALFNAERRKKNDLIFEALGTVDELNSFIGLASTHLHHNPQTIILTLIQNTLSEIQQHLLDIGSIIATPASSPRRSFVSHCNPASWTLHLEHLIDQIDATLPPLSNFIIPGGSLAAAQLHVCRSVCRRAERCVTTIREAQSDDAQLCESAIYINRLSDFFFVAARAANTSVEIGRKSTSKEV